MISLNNFIKQLFHVISSNFVKLLVTGLLTIIVPKFISVRNYGFWQLYIFYSSYVGFFHLGWCDGIYLREGGNRYNDLNFSNYKTQFFLLFFLELFFLIFAIPLLYISDFDIEKKIIIFATCLNALIVIPCTFLNYLMQSTGRIKEFSYATILGRLVYFLLVIICILFKQDNYLLVIFSDLFGWIITLTYSCISCKELFLDKFEKVLNVLSDIYCNINVGSKLMIANIASTLIIGIIRFNIENYWSIEIFGKISLCINFCNLILIFINAISIVLYPILRKVNDEQLIDFYDLFDKLLTPFLFITLIIYFPIVYFISIWLPQYQVSIQYMAILFPICIYESKVSLLIYTFLKVKRKENIIMIVNIVIVLFSIILSFISVYLLNSLILTVFSILFLLLCRCIVLELVVDFVFKCKHFEIIVQEFVLTILFLFASLALKNILGFLLYSIIIILCVLLNRKKIIKNVVDLINKTMAKG